MTDAELIARLRTINKNYELARGVHVDIRQAADRIEALIEERDDYAHKLMQANNTYTEMHLEIERLSDKLATCEKYRDAYAECDRIGTQAVRDLEAKLAEFRHALFWCGGSADFNEGGVAREGWLKVCAPLLKGESHE